MNKPQLEALETEIRAELYALGKAENFDHDPITDGVVDIDLYLKSSPRILWILKEPWEPLEEGEGGGGWSVTKELIPKLLAEGTIGGISTYRKMAYVTYSVFHNFVPYAKIDYPRDDPQVGASLKRIAYINVSKFPGKTRSSAHQIAAAYQRNRHILPG